MASQENTKVDLERYTKNAVQLALQGRWQEAVEANKSILESFPDDVETYNRLGRALMELGEYAEAKKAYEHALELDPFNSIAKKNLNRLALVGKRSTKANAHKVLADIFVEETGKARVVKLVNLAPKEEIAKMAPGEEVGLYVEGQRLLVKNKEGDYLGEVEPKYGARLSKLTKLGNRYMAVVSSIGENELKVIIREIYQHPSQEGRPSFPLKDKEGFRPYVRESLLRYRLEDDELPEEIDGTIEAERDGFEGFSISEIYEHPADEEGGMTHHR